MLFKKFVLINAAIIILSCYDYTFSQSKLMIGFGVRDEFVHEVQDGTTFQYHNEKSFFEIPHFDLAAIYNFSEDYSLEFNAGYKFQILSSESFMVGPDYGISIRRAILSDWLYGKLNYTLHVNMGGMGHAGQSGGELSYEGVYPMIGAGIDICTSKDIFFNLMFLKLLKEKIAYSYSNLDTQRITGEYKFPFLISFGFTFYWQVL